jgi:hypothetical protein
MAVDVLPSSSIPKHLRIAADPVAARGFDVVVRLRRYLLERLSVDVAADYVVADDACGAPCTRLTNGGRWAPS